MEKCVHAILKSYSNIWKILCACKMWKYGQKWASFILNPVNFVENVSGAELGFWREKFIQKGDISWLGRPVLKFEIKSKRKR